MTLIYVPLPSTDWIYEMIRWQPEKHISKSAPIRTPKVSAFSSVYLKHLAQRNRVNLKRHNRTRLFVRLNSRARRRGRRSRLSASAPRQRSADHVVAASHKSSGLPGDLITSFTRSARPRWNTP